MPCLCLKQHKCPVLKMTDEVPDPGPNLTSVCVGQTAGEQLAFWAGINISVWGRQDISKTFHYNLCVILDDPNII